MKRLDEHKWGSGPRTVALLLGMLLGAACSSGDPDDETLPLDQAESGGGGSAGQSGASAGSVAVPPASSSGTGGGGAMSGAGGSASEGATSAGSNTSGADNSGGTAGDSATSEDGGRSGRGGAPRGGRGGRGGASSGGSSGSSPGGSSSGGMTQGTDQEGELAGTLEAHNIVRAMVADADPPLPPLTWSDEIAEFAQEWADTLASECESIRHRQQNRYGENIAAQWSFGGQSTEPYGPVAVEAWAAEIECWEFGSITGLGVQGTEMCDAQCIAAQNSSGCGHYTQLVWRTTQRVGCGYASCETGNRRLMEIAVCNYDPPGNYVGEEPY